MDTSNWRPTQGPSGAVGDSMESGDWRAQLQADSPPDSRQRVVNKIMDISKRHLPFSGHKGLQELKKIAVRFEENIYTAAPSQSDYLRWISLKMLTMVTRSQNPKPDAMQANSAANSINPSDPVTYHKDGVVINEAEDDINPYKRDPLCEIVGPMTRSRTKRMNDALNKRGEH